MRVGDEPAGGRCPSGRDEPPRATWLLVGGVFKAPDHFVDGADACDGLGRKRERISDRAGQLAVEVNRASAHARRDPGLRQHAAGKARQNQRLPGCDIFENAKDFDVEFFHLLTGKDCLSGALDARFDLVEREEVGRLR